MKNTKQVLTRILAVFIIFMAFFTPLNDAFFAYADTTTDNWQNVTTNAELVEAFKYYCKSRDITFEGSAADAVTSFTTQTFNSICNGLGIDVTALQAHLKKSTDGSGVRFLFDSTGITAYNRIFSQFLQDNELDVGDTVNDKNLYSGEYFVDYDGNTCLVFVASTMFSGLANDDYITAFGTPYKYNGIQIANMYPATSTLTFNLLENNSSTVTINNTTIDGYTFLYANNATSYRFHCIAGDKPCDGYFAIIKTTNNRYYFGVYSRYDSFGNIKYTLDSIKEINRTNIAPSITLANISITTNNNTINNNNYEGDTIINNYGTPSEPDTPDTPDEPDDPEPPETDPPDWGIDWPDLNIDWILAGKENKFPFDIPFNVMFALSLLNAEPQTPELQGTLDLGVYQWEYDLSLEQFDDIAATCRNIEFLAFLIGLMLMTKKLIWG